MTKTESKSRRPKKRVLEKLSREEMADVQGGRKKAVKKKRPAKKKRALGRQNACIATRENENANIPFCE